MGAISGELQETEIKLLRLIKPLRKLDSHYQLWGSGVVKLGLRGERIP